MGKGRELFDVKDEIHSRAGVAQHIWIGNNKEAVPKLLKTTEHAELDREHRDVIL